MWTLGRGGDARFFRPVDPRGAACGSCRSPTSPDEDVGDRILRSIAVLGAAFADRGERYDVVHAQDCISANAVARLRAHRPPPRHVHHPRAGRLPRAGDRAPEPRTSACRPRWPPRSRAGWGRRRRPSSRTASTPPASPPPQPRPRPPAAAGGAGGSAATCWPSAGSSRARARSTCSRPARWLRRERPGPARWSIAGGETLFDYRDYRAARRGPRRRARRRRRSCSARSPHDELPALVAGAAALRLPVHEGGVRARRDGGARRRRAAWSPATCRCCARCSTAPQPSPQTRKASPQSCSPRRPAPTRAAEQPDVRSPPGTPGTAQQRRTSTSTAPEVRSSSTADRL